jgi:hypothetical protein
LLGGAFAVKRFERLFIIVPLANKTGGEVLWACGELFIRLKFHSFHRKNFILSKFRQITLFKKIVF